MDVLETWIVFGVPGLLLAATMYVGNSARRALFGHAVLLGTMLIFVLVPGDRFSAVAIGLLLVVLVANGRGFSDDRLHEHHQHRERFTVAKH